MLLKAISETLASKNIATRVDPDKYLWKLTENGQKVKQEINSFLKDAANNKIDASSIEKVCIHQMLLIIQTRLVLLFGLLPSEPVFKQVEGEDASKIQKQLS